MVSDMRREIIKIGICDADRKFTGEIEMFIICSEKRYNLHFEVDVFFSGEKLCEAINKGIFFDIILLDFKIGNMNANTDLFHQH